mmetsp:Transcript_8093/g.11682  ORF Transcript_8093/g.11682 Transcript_8093/m.11682 type:complete len:183 (-) Transcript_8093:321-869(-)
MVQALYSQKAEFETQHALLGQVKDATFVYAFSGKPMVMRDKTAKMIQSGIASVVFVSGENTPEAFVDCKVDEPIMVQACINFLDVQALLETEMALARGSSHLGDGFEHYMLPAIQQNFMDVLKEQLHNNSGDYDNFSVPKLSSYGVLARDCSADIDRESLWKLVSKAWCLRFASLIHLLAQT